MRIHRTLATAAAAFAVLAAAAAPAGAQKLHGTVVHHNRHAHSFVVAMRGGALRSVHAAALPGVGRNVSVDARKLRNGTFAAHRVHAGKRHRHVRLHGTVSFADRHRHRFVLSSNGASLLLRARHAKLPSAGTSVDVEATVPAGGTPIAQQVTTTGTDFTIELEGAVLAVDQTARTITISADDDEQSGAQLTIGAPASIDLTQIVVGQEVELLVALHSDGTFTLLGLAGDENAEQADDQGEQQGQDVEDEHGDGHEDGGDREDGGTPTTTTPSGDGERGDGGGGDS